MHRLAALVLVCWVGLVAAACGGDAAKTSDLVMYTWEDYVPQDVLDDFAREFGTPVRVETFGTQPEAISRLQEDSGELDVLVGTGDIVGQLADLRLVSELDHAQLPNLANIDPKFLGWSWDPNNRFSAPYDWGTTGLLYDTETVARPDSWKALGTQRDTSRVALDADWLVTLGLSLKSTGYRLNSDDDGELASAADEVARLRQAGVPLMESVDLREALIAGHLDLGMSYSGDAAIAMGKNPRLGWVIPREGADLYMDVSAIVAASQHKAEAHALVNFLMRPDIQARITAATGYGNPNRESARLGLSSVDRVHSEIAAAAMDRLEPWESLAGPRQARWNRAWARADAPAADAR